MTDLGSIYLLERLEDILDAGLDRFLREGRRGVESLLDGEPQGGNDGLTSERGSE